MRSDREAPAVEANPLAGVLDRLRARERGEKIGSRPGKGRAEEAKPVSHASRRMLVAAALGTDGGAHALRSIAGWAARSGRRPAVFDLACGEPALATDPEQPASTPATERIPVACIPCGPDRLRELAPEVLNAVLARLRVHESSSDLLLVRVPPHYRLGLMRAAFLAGGLVLPLEESEGVIEEAFRLSREARESFLDLSLWPLARDPAALTRYHRLTREFLKIEPPPLDPEAGDLGPVLESSSEPPEEGFLISLLAPAVAVPPADLFHVGLLPG